MSSNPERVASNLRGGDAVPLDAGGRRFIFEHMKKISVWLSILMFTAALAGAQETATQQQLDKLSGQIQDVQDALRLQDQRIAALEKQLGDLRDKVNTPVSTPDYASNADLKRLAEQVHVLDRQRADDREVILAQLDKLSKAAANAVTPLPPPRHPATSKPEDAPASDVPAKGYYYEVKQGDNLGLIVKAYREQGVKVTKSQIIKANPKMNPDVLIPGKKIFIPDPNAK